MSKNKNTFTAQFKAKVALDALNENKTINEISSAYNVHPTQIAKWKKELRENGAAIFQKKKEKNKNKNTDVNELHRIIGEQATQLEWFKKKF